jgi:hypothetical protein
MALANFFDKAALAAAEVLQNFDRDAFTKHLTRRPVALAFDAGAAASFEGRTTLELAANLLARLYPKLALVPLDKGVADTASRLEAVCRAINPEIELSAKLAGAIACLVVGRKRPRGGGAHAFVGSDGWVVRASSGRPVGSGSGAGNPFGAAAAACFGAANVFRIFFAAQLPSGAPDRDFALSLLDYQRAGAEPANPALPATVDLGETHLVGLGAIGNGFVWTLARIPSLAGTLSVVDHELVDLTNLQRYVLATQGDQDRPKTELVSRALADTGVLVHPYQKRWGEYLKARGDTRLECVAVALDSAEDRVAVQAGLPRWVCNAWTQPGDLGVSRHDFLGGHACLACLYMPKGQVPNADQLVARAINMPEALGEVRTLLHNNAPVGEAFVRRMATAMTVPVEPLLRFAAKPLGAFYAEAVCGGMLLKLGAHAAKADTQAPMAFQSALAGVLLAAELVSHVANLKGPPPPSVTRINLLRPLAEYITFPELKRPMCICQDSDYQNVYRRKYLCEH